MRTHPNPRSNPPSPMAHIRGLGHTRSSGRINGGTNPEIQTS